MTRENQPNHRASVAPAARSHQKSELATPSTNRSLRLGERPGRFRLGATSFVHEGGWAENVARLGERVDDIELLFFEAHALPCAEEIAELRELKRRHRLTYSLHTPLDVELASDAPARREQSIADVQRALDAARPLEPEHVVVHVCPTEPMSDPTAWRERARCSLRAIVEHSGERTVCIETLDEHFVHLEELLGTMNLRLALDVGHFVRDGLLLDGVTERFLPHTAIVQWHGVAERDHRSLRHFPEEDARKLVTRLFRTSFSGVVTLEVFNEQDFEESMEIAGDLFDEWATGAHREAL